jgi:hypothetical protein
MTASSTPSLARSRGLACAIAAWFLSGCSSSTSPTPLTSHEFVIHVDSIGVPANASVAEPIEIRLYLEDGVQPDCKNFAFFRAIQSPDSLDLTIVGRAYTSPRRFVLCTTSDSGRVFVASPVFSVGQFEIVAHEPDSTTIRREVQIGAEPSSETP